MKLNQKYVVKCIKGNNDRCGFGYRYKVDQYVTYSGRPTNVLDEAHVYKHLRCSDSFPEYNGCALEDDNNDDWKVYFEFVPVSVTIKEFNRFSDGTYVSGREEVFANGCTLESREKTGK